MEKLYEGLVKGVPSGDSIIISGKVKKNSDDVPEEKTIFLSVVSAPRCAHSNNPEEEPYGWESRDFLRRAVLGKVVKYTVDYKINDRTFGQVYLEGKNVAIDLVKNGLAKVGFISKNNESLAKGEYFTKLQSSENEAKKSKVNIWGNQERHKRKIVSMNDDDYNTSEILNFCKGKEMEGIVEYVINCAVYIIFIKDLKTYIKTNLRFVALPNSKDTVIYKAGKAYVERLLLHHDVKVIVHAVDDNKNFTSDVIDKKGSFATFIVRNGYTKLYLGNNTYLSEEITALKQAQSHAKKDKLRVWKDDTSEETEGGLNLENAEKKIETLEGICLQVHSGDSLTIKTSSGQHRIFLSHLKAPNLAKPGTEEPDQPWAWQAREHLRKVLVGRNVRCELDYSRVIQKDNKSMNFYSVIRTDFGKDGKEKNINSELIEQGLVNFIPPRGDKDGISRYLDTYTAADKIAKDKKVGVNSQKIPPNPNYSDLISANKTKKKEFSSFLINKKNLSCVVEYVFSGSKFKLRIDNNKCMIPFSILGIKTVQKDKNNTDIMDLLHKQAIDFSNDNILQREAICDITQCDRVGNYFGYLYVDKVNYATTLIKEGLAVFNPVSNVLNSNEFKKAEQEAESLKKGVWAYDNVANFLKDGENFSLPESFKERNDDIKVRVTDYIDFNNFYVNILPNKTLKMIEDVLSKYDSGKLKGTPIEPPVKKGLFCIAKYKNDDKYYRAHITRVLKDDKFEVEFIDYGTVDTVLIDDLIKMDSTISTFEPQGILCEFAYLKYSKNSMKKALDKYTDFVIFDLVLPAKACYSYNQDSKNKLGVVVCHPNGDVNNSYHNDLINVGYAKFDAKKKIPDYLKVLKNLEKKADEKGIGLWAENEASDYGEDEEI
jgi:staphylococcal nuclease domain-containing protein 1